MNPSPVRATQAFCIALTGLNRNPFYTSGFIVDAALVVLGLAIPKTLNQYQVISGFRNGHEF
jgi:hypothetical protein